MKLATYVHNGDESWGFVLPNPCDEGKDWIFNPKKAEELLLQKYIDTTKNKLKNNFWQRLFTNSKINRATNFAIESSIIKNTPESINKFQNRLEKEFATTPLNKRKYTSKIL